MQKLIHNKRFAVQWPTTTFCKLSRKATHKKVVENENLQNSDPQWQYPNIASCVTQAAWKVELKSQSCCYCFLPLLSLLPLLSCHYHLFHNFGPFVFLFINSKSWMVIIWNWFVYKYKGFLHFTSSDGWLTCELYRFFQWFYWLKDLVEGRALWASLSRGDGFVLSSVTKNRSSVGKSFSM